MTVWQMGVVNMRKCVGMREIFPDKKVLSLSLSLSLSIYIYIYIYNTFLYQLINIVINNLSLFNQILVYVLMNH